MGVDLLDQALTFLGAAGLGTALGLVYDPVSYTQLDVYKRQV